LKIAAGALAISVFALAAALAYRWHRPQRPQEQAALTVIPFTAFPGVATSPAFSAMAPESASHGTVTLHMGTKASIYM